MAPRKGRLDSILLSDLLASLAESQATGMLSVRNNEDSKKVVLDQGQIAISSTGMNEKVLLGDLLIARGLVTEADVEQALEMQRAARKRLGELLIELKGLTEQNINDAVQFQVEEEILDLFTWRKGEFEFTEEVTAADREAIAKKGTSFTIDTRKIITEAGKRAEEWLQLEQRITSPYLVFRPTDKAAAPAIQNQLAENAIRRRVFKWVQENRTVDTMVIKSCIGRNALYKLLIEWIDEHNIELVPVGELKFLASEHRSRHRYYDAMGVYRRLRDAARTDAERRALEGSIADTKAAMEAQIAESQAANLVNQTASLAHVKRAAALRRSRIMRLAAMYAGGGVLVLAVLFYLAIQIGTNRTKEYEMALAGLDQTIRVQMESGAAEAARTTCRQLQEQYPNLAADIDTRLTGIDRERREQATRKRQEIRSQVGRLDLADLHARLQELQAQFPDLPELTGQIEKDHAEMDRELLVRKEQLRTNSLRKWYLSGAVRQAEGDFAQAREAYFRARALTVAGDPEAVQIAGQLAAIEAIEQQQREQLQAASALEAAGADLSAALAKYEELAAAQPRLAWGAQAAERATVLQAELAQAQKRAKAARDLAGSGDVLAAEQKLRQAIVQLAPYGNLSVELQNDLNTLVTRRLQVEGQIREAQELDLQNRLDAARLKWAALMARSKADLVRRKLTVPYSVTSNPPGAEVTVDGKVLGQTPLTFRLPADDDRPIDVRMPGFAAHRLTLDERVKLLAEVTLSIEPLWSLRLGAGGCNGLLFDERNLYVLNGGRLLGLRPADKTALFEPQELIALPVGDRKREAANFSGELKPPAWWALQHVPTLTARRDFAWVPLQDSRIVRLSLTDLTTAAVRSPIEAGTPLTVFPNPFVKNLDLALFVGLDNLLYEMNLQDLEKGPQAMSKLKYKSLPVRMAGSDVAVAVSESGELVRLPIGDYDNAKAYPVSAPIVGAIQMLTTQNRLGEPRYQALVVEDNGGLELFDLTDMTVAWSQSADRFAVRTLRLLEDGQGFLQTGIGGGQSLLELRSLDGGGLGRAVWSIPLEGSPIRPCAGGGTIYVATDDKILLAFRQADGKLLWKSPIPGLPERIEAQADGTVALVVRQDENRTVLIYKVELSE